MLLFPWRRYRGFYEHAGMDFIATGRAILNDIKAMSLVEGTITQQLAKTFILRRKRIYPENCGSVYGF